MAHARLQVVGGHLRGEPAALLQRGSTATASTVRASGGAAATNWRQWRAQAGTGAAAVHALPLFRRGFQFTDEMMAAMDLDGHVVLPGVMDPGAVDVGIEAAARLQATHEAYTERVTPAREALTRQIQAASTPAARQALERRRWEPQEELGGFNLILNPGSNCAEMEPFFEGCIGHPDMLGIVRRVLGPSFRFDHCTMANRRAGDGGIGFHVHGGADRDSSYAERRGFIRVFFYLNGFADGDGNLKVIRGSHLHRADPAPFQGTDEGLRAGWLAGRTHPVRNTSLQIEPLEVGPGTVVVMWTAAAHGVNPKLPRGTTATRYTLITGYRNPMAREVSKWITPRFLATVTPGLTQQEKDVAVLDEAGVALGDPDRPWWLPAED